MRLPSASLAAACAALLEAASLSGCAAGDHPERNGQLALATRGGHVLVLAHACSGGVRDVEISADREGLSPDRQNPVLGALRARTPATGSVTIDLDAPGPEWEVTTPIRLPADPARGVIVTARDEPAHTEMQQTDAHMRQVRALRDGQVIVGANAKGEHGQVVSAEEFRAHAC